AKVSGRHQARSPACTPRRPARTSRPFRQPGLVDPGARSPEATERTMMSVQTPRFRPILDQFSGYKPGKPPAAMSGPTYKLASHESPYGPLPSVLKVMADAASEVNRYPDNGAVQLTEAIAARYGGPASH